MWKKKKERQMVIDSRMPNEIGCGKSASAYTDDVTINGSNEAQLPCVEEAIKGYDAGAKVNKDKSIVFSLGTWSSKMITFSIVGH